MLLFRMCLDGMNFREISSAEGIGISRVRAAQILKRIAGQVLERIG